MKKVAQGFYTTSMCVFKVVSWRLVLKWHCCGALELLYDTYTRCLVAALRVRIGEIFVFARAPPD